MKKYIYVLLAVIIVSLAIYTTVFANNATDAIVSHNTMYLNGRQIECCCFNISGNNYFKLRDLAEVLSGTTSQFDVSWNGGKNIIEITTGKAYTPIETQEIIYYYYYSDTNYPAIPTTSKVLADGKLQNVTAYNIDGNNYFKLRDLANLIPFDVDWDSKKNAILIFPKLPQNAYRTKTAYDMQDNTVSPYFSRWRSTITSYLINNNDKTIGVVEAKSVVQSNEIITQSATENAIENVTGNNGIVTIETYNEDYSLIGKKSIEYELPIFGGFFSGDKYNYIAFGQDNSEENDEEEVIRIVKYDKNFNRIDSVSIKGRESYTIMPFQSGSGKMAECGDKLVFHTSRKRYTTEDGLNHQSQLTIIVDTKDMKVVNDLGSFQRNHVSHSFDQYVLFDGNIHVLVDHGDAYPRSIVLNKENGENYSEVNLFEIPGKIGANCTGVSIGGFEITPTSYIVAMNTIDHSMVSEYTSYEMVGLDIDQRDIIICVLPKDSIEKTSVKQVTLAKYVGSNKIASIPQFVKVSDENYMVIWQEYDINSIEGSTYSNTRSDLKYIFVDKNGNPTSEIQTVKNFVLSTCKPIVINNNVVWYTDEGSRVFYSIPLE